MGRATSPVLAMKAATRPTPRRRPLRTGSSLRLHERSTMNTISPDGRRRPTLGDVISTGSGLPSRGVIYGPEGTGKTTLGAMFPKPVFLMTRGETGLETLIDAGRVAETP